MDDFIYTLESFFSQFKLRFYRRKDLILHEDDIPNGIYFIKSGYIRMYSLSKEGEELTRLILGPHDIFPTRWIFGDEPIDYYAEPLTDFECWYAPKQVFLDYLQANPKLYMLLLRYLSHRMNMLYDRLESLTFGDAYQKIVAMLLLLAKQFGIQTSKGMLITVPLSQKDFGSLIGLARETVNECMEEMKTGNLIAWEDHKITILNLSKLEKEI
jgi:CRP/FNR family transcriptional regulator